MAIPGAIARPLAVMMSRDIRTVAPEATLRETAMAMRRDGVGALLVQEHGDYIGIVTETDLVRKAMAAGLDPATEPVRAVMSSPLITIEIHRSAHDASDRMAEHRIRHLAVTQDGRVVGVLSVRDLLCYFKNWGTI
jgi:CBS domain-containing protein